MDVVVVVYASTVDTTKNDPTTSISRNFLSFPRRKKKNDDVGYFVFVILPTLVFVSKTNGKFFFGRLGCPRCRLLGWFVLQLLLCRVNSTVVSMKNGFGIFVWFSGWVVDRRLGVRSSH